ncbi:hypothetical protein BCR42DRAFT_431232 [Absidia repens]|uniref:Uncharacterized protein n=1 Tax=Absidia repens TaxID=90262 RepID=A0A1X2J170_9FUNG|nr:hypothetical protein BCR42DRAFT_431232 [Absidia repens]
MTALLRLQVTKMARRLLPTWFLRLLGFSCVAIAIVNFVILICRRFPLPIGQFIKKDDSKTSSSETVALNKALKRTSSVLVNIQQDTSTSLSSPYTHTGSAQLRLGKWWGLRLIDCAIAAISELKQKKKLTISLKNTILWNPSQDITVTNHAFVESAILLLSRLCKKYEVYLIIHTNNDDEHNQIQHLLAPIIGSLSIALSSSSTKTTPLLNKSRIIYCQDEMTKIQIVQSSLCPAIHVEGGCELTDGGNIIRGLQSSVDKIVWVTTRRRRASFIEANIDHKDQGMLTDGLELTDSLLDSSLARFEGTPVVGHLETSLA